jgi:hypothetical protein
MRITLVLLATAACTDPVVEMQLVMPKDGVMNTSCISAVEVHANGAHYPANVQDTERSCIEISGGATYSSVRDAIRGKFELGVPDSGLASIEIYGWSGPQPCTPDDDPYYSPNLLFFGSGSYIGQDQVDIPVVPNLDCTTEPVKIHMIDMMALVGGASCANASNVGAMAGAGLGTLVPKFIGKGVDFYGNQEGNNLVDNVAAFDGHTRTGTHSCLALDGGSETGGSTGCAIGGAAVCAAPGEYEQAYVPGEIINAAFTMDQNLTTKYPAIYLVSVFGATKTTLGGAKIDVDPTHAKVVYVDPPSGTQTTFKARTDGATGPSGLALVYLDTLVSAKVTAGTLTRTVTLGAPDQSLGAGMVVLQ